MSGLTHWLWEAARSSFCSRWWGRWGIDCTMSNDYVKRALAELGRSRTERPAEQRAAATEHGNLENRLCGTCYHSHTQRPPSLERAQVRPKVDQRQLTLHPRCLMVIGISSRISFVLAGWDGMKELLHCSSLLTDFRNARSQRHVLAYSTPIASCSFFPSHSRGSLHLHRPPPPRRTHHPPL